MPGEAAERDARADRVFLFGEEIAQMWDEYEAAHEGATRAWEEHQLLSGVASRAFARWRAAVSERQGRGGHGDAE